MPASRASSNAWRTPDAAVSVIGSIVEPRHTIIHSDVRIDNGDRHQLFVFIRRKLMPPSFFCQTFQSHQVGLSVILQWSTGILEISGIWRLKSYARTRGLSASSGLRRRPPGAATAS